VTLRKSLKAASTITEEIAIRKATEHLTSRTRAYVGWQTSATKKEDGNWFVHFEARPAYPGGHRTVVLSLSLLTVA
jgi:hypothetical protein